MFSFCWRLAPNPLHTWLLRDVLIWSTFLPRRLHAEIFGNFLLRRNTYNSGRKPARVPKMTRSRFSAPDFFAITAHTCAPAVNCRTVVNLDQGENGQLQLTSNASQEFSHKHQIWSSFGRNKGQERVAPLIPLSSRARSGEGGPAWFIYLPLPEKIFLILSFSI